MSERQNIEWKQSWHDDYLKWVCGFANAIGGMIYIGIDNKGNVTHLADYAKLMEDIPNKIRNAMESATNKAFLAKGYKVFLEYLQSSFGVTSEKLRNNFGKESA